MFFSHDSSLFTSPSGSLLFFSLVIACPPPLSCLLDHVCAHECILRSMGFLGFRQRCGEKSFSWRMECARVLEKQGCLLRILSPCFHVLFHLFVPELFGALRCKTRGFREDSSFGLPGGHFKPLRKGETEALCLWVFCGGQNIR